MLKSRERQKVPQVRFPIRVDGEWQKVSTDSIFKGKTVALFSLPRTFTPTCLSMHLPLYNELATILKDNGVGSMVSLGLNDSFVMETWQHEQQADDIDFLPDGNSEFTTGMAMLEMPFHHPVIEEGVRTALRNLNQHLHIGVEGIHDCMEFGPVT